MKLLAKLLGAVFYALWLLTGIILFYYYWTVLDAWIGSVLGTVLAIFTSPGVFLFPIVYWIVERQFPIFYFELLGVGLVCLILGGVCWRLGGTGLN
jgi:hypothetical protein